jgi:hypothetical protein
MILKIIKIYFVGTNQIPTLFWTSGGDKNCNENFSWFPKSKKLPNDTPWLLGEPSSNAEYGVAFYVSSNIEGLVDWYQNTKIRYICEV